MQQTALVKFAALYPLPWDQLWDAAAKDKELVDATAQLIAAGYDPKTFVRDIPIRSDGVIVGSLTAFQAKYPQVFGASAVAVPAPASVLVSSVPSTVSTSMVSAVTGIPASSLVPAGSSPTTPALVPVSLVRSAQVAEDVGIPAWAWMVLVGGFAGAGYMMFGRGRR